VCSQACEQSKKKKFAFSNASLVKVAPRTASGALVHDRQAATKALGQVLRVHLAAQRLDAAEALCAL
jgi:hypothetical protein